MTDGCSPPQTAHTLRAVRANFRRNYVFEPYPKALFFGKLGPWGLWWNKMCAYHEYFFAADPLEIWRGKAVGANS